MIDSTAAAAETLNETNSAYRLYSFFSALLWFGDDAVIECVGFYNAVRGKLIMTTLL